MAAVQASLPLGHFYRETLGSDHISQNLASNELFTPLQLDRKTISPSRFENYRSSLEKKPRLPWGRFREYGGLQKVQLPSEFVKPKGYPPEVVQKGHRHYGSGMEDSRDHAIPQYYDITKLHKSHVRTSDQVLPPSPDKEMNKRQIDLPFPAEHPYASHTPRLALFPKFNTPDDPNTGDPARSPHPLHANAPANGYDVAIINKAKGSPYRREHQDNPLESEKEALTWPGEGDFYQLMKSPDGGKQPYYPISPNLIRPNLRMRNEDQRLELRTVNALRNVERDQWKTTYDYNFTGYGPSNALHLDDYHTKMVDEITSGRDTRNDDLMPSTSPSYIPPRPVEGRYARLYQGKRHLTADIRYPDDDPKPDPSDVMDSRGYSSLPGTPTTLRRKDEWYKTGRASAEADIAKVGDTERKTRSAFIRRYDTEEEDIWKTLQLNSSQEHGLLAVKDKKAEEPDPRVSGEYDCLPKTIEEQITLPEEPKYYLKDYQQERDDRFKQIERENEQLKLELQYRSSLDLHALKNKVEQMGTRLQPKALDQHAGQVTQDQSRLEELQTSGHEFPERYDTGLKFTTEKINDRGTLTDLHDRQLEGYKDFPTTWHRDIPVTDPSEQNHKGVLWSYITRTNPFSLSHDVQNANVSARSGERASLSRSSTGSILKTPGSPPRTGSSKSISFNEVVRVASSEYGTRFKVSTSPLSSIATTPSYRQTRPSTPLPTPPRAVKEPSVHSGTTIRGPALRPSSAFPHEQTKPTSRDHWRWSYDVRMKAQFEPESWSPQPGVPRPQTSLLKLQNRWNKSDTHKRLHEDLPETPPDFRDNVRHYEFADKSSDLRFHHSIKHREKRHQFYGFNSYHFYNGNALL